MSSRQRRPHPGFALLLGASLHLLAFVVLLADPASGASGAPFQAFLGAGLFVWCLFGPLTLIARRRAKAFARADVVVRRGHWYGYPGRP